MWLFAARSTGPRENGFTSPSFDELFNFGIGDSVVKFRLKHNIVAHDEKYVRFLLWHCHISYGFKISANLQSFLPGRAEFVGNVHQISRGGELKDERRTREELARAH